MYENPYSFFYGTLYSIIYVNLRVKTEFQRNHCTAYRNDICCHVHGETFL